MSGPCVIGLDLSLASTGIASSDGWLKRVQSKGAADATFAARARRIRDMRDEVLATVDGVGLVVIEGPSYGQSRGSSAGSHDRSGLWWLVACDLHAAGVPVAVAAPAARTKYATGRGNASKDAVLAAVVRRFPAWDVDGNDVADALVLAAMGADGLGHPLVAMPGTHRAALDAVAWPLGSGR